VTWMKLRHQNIHELYGYTTAGPYGFSLVLPFLEKGDLRAYRKEEPTVSRTSSLVDVVRGLRYLHGQDPPIAHGDMRPVCSAVHITMSYHTGLMQGLLEYQTDGWSESIMDPFCSRWFAPEVLNPDSFGIPHYLPYMTPEADIYAFGMVAYWIYADREPFSDMRNPYRIATSVLAGGRPPHPGPEADSAKPYGRSRRGAGRRTLKNGPFRRYCRANLNC
ncbi:hypothetical protein CALCODRAFT_437870, partial [Calocera cornea HHB12733]